MKKSELTLDKYSEVMYEAPFNQIPANEQEDCKEEYDTLMLMEDAEFKDAWQAVLNPYDAAATADVFEILYTATLGGDLEYSDIQKIFELGKQNPNGKISTAIYADETIIVVYKGPNPEDLAKEIADYIEN